MSGSVLKLLSFISLLFDLTVTQVLSDPCTTYTPFPDSDRRGINYTLSNGESSIDDNELTEGWYGDKRYTLVEESPGFYKCGGWYPIYVQEQTNSNLTMCVQSTSDACAYTISVEARQCSGFKVYHLPQAPVHRAVYCLVANPEASPQFDEKPNITFELMDKELSSELLFSCYFNRSSENLFYKTIWYVEGAPIYTFEPLEWNSDDFDYIANRTLTEQLLKDNGVEKAGFNLQCGVQALYAPGGATSSGKLSEVQFVGVKIQWIPPTLSILTPPVFLPSSTQLLPTSCELLDQANDPAPKLQSFLQAVTCALQNRCGLPVVTPLANSTLKTVPLSSAVPIPRDVDPVPAGIDEDH
ncbi:uncharacterized protein LOC125377692 [Haliotis rufescens]|uniref:uncharacterized protein LOC125377692 n=1 Tax=Haliotis rufescens TaxID=6454 RepID=UPI00201F0EA2|nr:uncharacterized protein LOC125377692 [Haliotis rufescens]